MSVPKIWLQPIGAGLSVAFILAVGLYFALNIGLLRFNYPDRVQFPIRGIDISHHQGQIDWRSVAATEIEFVFIKASEGGDFVDPRFADNWHHAKSNGLLVGAYHFFTLCRSGAEQVANFLQVAPIADSKMPPVVDLEYGGNCSARPDKADFLAELGAFLSPVEAMVGRPVLLYVTEPFYQDYLLGQVPTNPLWVRNIFHQPRLPDGRSWAFWQFTNRGRIDGIAGPVDLNIFSGDAQALSEFLNLAGTDATDID